MKAFFLVAALTATPVATADGICQNLRNTIYLDN